MMSSVIPARLEFQCGHAALVSLPRVKGESSVQRSDRIAREKSAAQSRVCDFCPPLTVAEVAQAIVVVAAQPAPPPAPVAPVAEEPVAPVAEEPVTPVAVPVLPVATPAAGATPTRTRRRVARPRRTSAPVAAPPSVAPNGHVVSYRFVVRFRTETVVEATDIRDALRQVESLGATEVLALTRHG
jgi:hypothetical protein